MANEQVLTVSLEEFGLSKYESQAYIALISKGTISASELAYYSEIPRTKIYPTLLKLESKKLAIISKSKPIMCTAISPEDAFDEVIHEQINKVNAISKSNKFGRGPINDTRDITSSSRIGSIKEF